MSGMVEYWNGGKSRETESSRQKIMKTTDTDPLAFAAVVVICIVFFVAQRISAAIAEGKRKENIYLRYGKSALAERLIEKTIWVGETARQLRDSLGPPLDVDQKRLKTKKKEIWKYHRTGSNRYALKITLDDDVVVGWDQK
jgi:hypothetical protein